NLPHESDVAYRTTMINYRFEFQYFYLNLYSGTQLLFNSFYNRTENSIGVNNEVTGIHNYSNALNTPYKSRCVNRLRFQTRINPIKTIFKLDLDYTNTVFNNYISTVKNKATNKQYRIK